VKEGPHLDRKPLRVITEKSSDFAQFAQDCVCFASRAGPQILRLTVGLGGGQATASPHHLLSGHAE
jgi:hypothetical protein